MADIQKCASCEKLFDFDRQGLGSDHGGFVCSAECGRQLAARQGHHYAIHDQADAVVATDVPLVASAAYRLDGLLGMRHEW